MLSKNTLKIIADNPPSVFRLEISGPLPCGAKVNVTSLDRSGHYALRILLERSGELKTLLATPHIFTSRQQAADYWLEVSIAAKALWQLEREKQRLDKQIKRLEKMYSDSAVQDQLLWSGWLAEGC